MLYITTVMITYMPRVTDHEERRVEISEAAWRMIEVRGLAGANVREIAREAGFTTGVLSHYFRDKRELLAFAFGLMVERSTKRISEAARNTGLMDALAQLLPLDDARRTEATVWLVLMTASLQDADLARDLKQRYDEARVAMTPVFEAAVGKTGEELRDAADELLAAVDGLTVAALTDPERYPPERQLELLRRTLVRRDLPPD